MFPDDKAIRQPMGLFLFDRGGVDDYRNGRVRFAIALT